MQPNRSLMQRICRDNEGCGTRPRLLGLVALIALVVGADGSARAGWPPAPDATAEELKAPANWPNDPDYGYAAAERASDRASGQWNLYSFLPDRSPGASPLRQGESASGMSVDLAWRHTIGDPRVRIAVIDSGIFWDYADLVEQVYLNAGELGGHKPHKADGTDCEGAGPLAGFDCNGDGMLSISDYAGEPSLLPAASDGHPQGDRNDNGVLDAGDLILQLSDGVDDDGNGYVDDIAGWDFYKDDNDPYDDPRNSHGIQEAEDAAAAANNGIGKAGACPGCRVVPLRVGDGYVANVQDYAQAVVYATDTGASVVLEALGSINQSSFAQAAVDYAYERGTVVIASMADENSRHHNMPAVANHTLPVHAIALAGSRESTMATSYLHFNTCSNYGGQNFLSAPGVDCSSEATAVLAGVMGLVYSASLKGPLDPPLRAGEARQLAMMTADDIDVSESREPDANAFYSQPGFDQRFGYGRVNANTAVEWVLEGRIPPEIELTAPRWFSVLQPDRATGPIDIVGTVQAQRATSFDYVVEWAPGVQPADDAFRSIPGASGMNVGSTVVAGRDEALAQLDIRDLEVDNPPDPDDSKHAENRYTITVRVRAVAHYGGTLGDVPAELRRTLYVHRDPDLLPGFPLQVGAVDNGPASIESSPKLADIDGDGVREIVSANADGLVHVFKVGPGGAEELAGFPYRSKPVDGLDPASNDAAIPSYRGSSAYTSGAVDTGIARESFVSTPAIADLDGDGKPEIVAASWDGSVYMIRADGTAAPGFPITLPRVPSCPLDPAATRPAPCMDETYRISRGSYGSPALADLTGDGHLDIVIAAFDGQVHVFQADGSIASGWPVEVHYTGVLTEAKEHNRITTTPTVEDFNGDGIPDVLVGSNERLGKGEGAGAFYLIDGRGNLAPGASGQSPPYFEGWPVSVPSLPVFPVIAEGTTTMAAAADFDGDGVPEAVINGNVSIPLIVPSHPGTQTGLGSLPERVLPERGVDAAGNVQMGLEPTAIFGPLSEASTPDTFFPLLGQPSIGDLDQDGNLDVVTSGGSLSLAQDLAAGSSGSGAGAKGQHLVAMWSGKTGKMLPASPIRVEDFMFFNNTVLADLTQDGYPEVITGTGGYYVRAFDACGREAKGFPKFTGQWIVGTVAVGDVTGDGAMELVVGTRSGWLYAWRTGATSDSVVQWESFHHDNRNTGSLKTPLEQGVFKTNVGTMVCGAAEPEDPEAEESGCGCALPGSRRGGMAAPLLIFAMCLASRRRS